MFKENNNLDETRNCCYMAELHIKNKKGKCVQDASQCVECSNVNRNYCPECEQRIIVARRLVIGRHVCPCGAPIAVCLSAPVPWICSGCRTVLGRVAAGCPKCQRICCFRCMWLHSCGLTFTCHLHIISYHKYVGFRILWQQCGK